MALGSTWFTCCTGLSLSTASYTYPKTRGHLVPSRHRPYKHKCAQISCNGSALTLAASVNQNTRKRSAQHLLLFRNIHLCIIISRTTISRGTLVTSKESSQGSSNVAVPPLILGTPVISTGDQLLCQKKEASRAVAATWPCPRNLVWLNHHKALMCELSNTLPCS